jgi:hypothetical protein
MTKQFAVDNDFLIILAEEKSDGEFFGPNTLYKRIKARRAGRFGKPDFEVSVSQVERSKEKLSKDGFIEVKISRASKEELYSVETVELTLWGLFRVLEYVFVQEALTGDTLRETLDRIAESQAKKLPLVFKKWRHFRSLGLQEKVVERLRSYFHFFPEGYHFTPEYCFMNSLIAAGAKEVTRNDFESMRLKTFYDYVLLFYPDWDFLTEEEMKLWNDALARDDETKRYVLERLCFRRDRCAPKVDGLNQRISFFKGSG